jgi:hypothetical protein
MSYFVVVFVHLFVGLLQPFIASFVFCGAVFVDLLLVWLSPQYFCLSINLRAVSAIIIVAVHVATKRDVSKCKIIFT